MKNCVDAGKLHFAKAQFNILLTTYLEALSLLTTVHECIRKTCVLVVTLTNNVKLNTKKSRMLQEIVSGTV